MCKDYRLYRVYHLIQAHGYNYVFKAEFSNKSNRKKVLDFSKIVFVLRGDVNKFKHCSLIGLPSAVSLKRGLLKLPINNYNNTCNNNKIT